MSEKRSGFSKGIEDIFILKQVIVNRKEFNLQTHM